MRDWHRAGTSGSNRIAVLLLMQILLLGFVVYLTRRNPALLAAGIFAFAYTLALINRLFEINNLTRQVEEAILNASPMMSMLHEDIEIQDKPDASELHVKHGTIHIKDISFSYPENTQNGIVFNHFSLAVQPGEKLA
jgi:ATP-binding cassette subfamily B multidrug efflux pump